MKTFDDPIVISLALAAACFFAAGFLLGAPVRTNISNEEWLGLTGGVATIFATIATISAAYYMSTKQKRNEMLALEHRVVFLISSISEKINSVCDGLQNGERKPEEITSISRKIELLKELSVELIPIYFLEVTETFIHVASVHHERLDLFTKYAPFIDEEETKREETIREIKTDISGLMNQLLNAMPPYYHLR